MACGLAGEGRLLSQPTKRVVEAALDDQLGYGTHDPAGRDGGNSRNGKRGKTVVTEAGPVSIEVPGDREGSFEPQRVEAAAPVDRPGSSRWSIPSWVRSRSPRTHIRTCWRFGRTTNSPPRRAAWAGRYEEAGASLHVNVGCRQELGPGR